MSKHATVSQIMAAMALLQENLVKREDGFEYKHGWSDDRIAVEIGNSISSISRLRRKEFGSFASLRRRPLNSKTRRLKSAEILRKLDRAIEMAEEVNAKLDNLIKSLS